MSCRVGASPRRAWDWYLTPGPVTAVLRDWLDDSGVDAPGHWLDPAAGSMLALGWRPAFHEKTGPAHKGAQDFIWAVLLPAPCRRTTWARLEKPR